METKMYKNVSLLATPTEKEHLVNKKYVDDAINLKIKDAVVAVFCEDLDATYNSVDKKLVQNVGKEFKFDGVTLALKDRVLVAGQLDATQNGIYVVTALGVAGTPSEAVASLGDSNTGVINGVTCTIGTFETKISTTGIYTFTYSDADTSWMLDGGAVNLADYGILTADTPADADTIVITYTEQGTGTPGELTRAEDFDGTEDIKLNCLIPVQRGEQNSDTMWVLANDTLPALDTDAFVFIKNKGAEGITSFKAEFKGDGVAKEFIITHGLGTTDVNVTIRNKATKAPCYFGVVPTSENVVTISSDVVLTEADVFEVVVMG